MDVNKVTLLGNLTKDPGKKELSSGQSISFFDLATNYSWKDVKTKKKKESVEYHHVLAWGKLAEIIKKYLKKGSRIYLEGRLQHQSWKDKKGNFQNKTNVVADNLIMLGHNGKKSAELAKEDIDVDEIKVDED